jgi:hypothetical protein
MDFKQVVVWPNTLMGDGTPEEFEAFILEELKTHAKFIGVFETAPDYEDAVGDEPTGGRADLCFYVASEDIPKFAVPRFAYGMRWLEDVLDNEHHHNVEMGVPEDYSIYPEEMRKLRTW